MALSSDLISQFVRITNDKKDSKKEESTVYGTTVVHDGSSYVRLDGSEILTPISTTADMIDGERVVVMIKNHNATVIGNISSPAARTDDVKDIILEKDEISKKISEFEIAIGDKVDVKDLNASNARIDTLQSDNVLIKESLTAVEGDISELESDNVTINETLTAQSADIKKIETDKLDAAIAEATYATIANLDATNTRVYNLESTYGDFSQLTTNRLMATEAAIDDLEANTLTATDIEGKYANIDFSNISKATMQWFYSNSGLIEDVVVGDGTITGKLVGVTISGNLLEGDTVVADKLVIKGEDGLYYKLNTDGMTTELEQTDYNSINGSIIKAKSITATKIDVKDLVAFDATIGGFNITENSLYSGTKESVDNTTRGIYLDSDGQVAFGDASNFLRYYKDSDNNYKLEISAASVLLGAKSIEEAIVDVQAAVDNIEVGGRNLLLNTGGGDPVVLSGGASYITAGITDISNTEDGLTLNCSTTETEIYYRFMSPGQCSNNLYILEAGKAYTFSGKAKVTTTSGLLDHFDVRIRCYVPGHGWAYNDIRTVIATEDTTDWVNFTSTFTIPEDATGCYVSLQLYYTDSWTGVVELKHLKFEKGNKPTDWTTAPEDSPTNKSMANALTELEIGGRNLLTNTKSLTGSNVLGNSVISEEEYNGFTVRYCDDSEATEGYVDILLFQSISLEKLGDEYTLSFYAKGTGTLFTYFYGPTGYVKVVKSVQSNGVIDDLPDGGTNWALTDTWTRYWVTWTLADEGDISIDKWVLFRIYNGGIANICGVKLEKGNKATNWTPAPEDLATAESLDKVKTIADTADEKAHLAESLIQQLSESISMLVTDGNGTSLMTQTDTGWTFSTIELQTAINAASENLDALNNSVDSVSNTVGILQEAVDHLGITAEYVKIITYEDEPCIELGESDSDFKLLITNTRIMFREGSGVPAYISNQSLYIKKAVIEEELQQGGFVWKARSNGNLGIVWKGETS